MERRPAGDLEPLGAEPPVASGAPRRPTDVLPTDASADPLGPLTLTMRVGLIVATVLCLVGALSQALAALWLVSLSAIVACGGSVLVRTGGLESTTFATCSVVAIGITIGLIVGIVSVWLHKSIRGTAAEPEDSRYVRRPIATTCLGLLAALLFVIVAGMHRSQYFPYPLATIVVLANTYFFSLFVVLACAHLAHTTWRDLARWAGRTRYRAGFLTATFALIGATGVGAFVMRWHDGPVSAAWAELDLDHVDSPTGLFDAEIKGLCLAAGEIEPDLAISSSAAPACGFLPNSESRQVEECLERLTAKNGPMDRMIEQLKQDFRRLSSSDWRDVVMDAVITTCIQEKERLGEPEAYLSTVATNAAKRVARAADKRDVPCEDFDDFEAPRCDIHDLLDDERRAQVWEQAMCSLDRRAAAIVRWRLHEGESFANIARRFGISENAAKDGFHNAIKSLRRLRIGDCFRADFRALPD